GEDLERRGEFVAHPAEDAVTVVLGIEADAAAGIIDPPVAALGQGRGGGAGGIGEGERAILILGLRAAAYEIDPAQAIGGAAGGAGDQAAGRGVGGADLGQAGDESRRGTDVLDPVRILDADIAGLVPVALAGLEDAVAMGDLALDHEVAAAAGEIHAGGDPARIVEAVAIAGDAA